MVRNNPWMYMGLFHSQSSCSKAKRATKQKYPYRWPQVSVSRIPRLCIIWKSAFHGIPNASFNRSSVLFSSSKIHFSLTVFEILQMLVRDMFVMFVVLENTWLLRIINAFVALPKGRKRVSLFIGNLSLLILGILIPSKLFHRYV